jgi:hypothetical protein
MVSEIGQSGLTVVVNGIATIVSPLKIFLTLSFTLILAVDNAVK